MAELEKSGDLCFAAVPSVGTKFHHHRVEILAGLSVPEPLVAAHEWQLLGLLRSGKRPSWLLYFNSSAKALDQEQLSRTYKVRSWSDIRIDVLLYEYPKRLRSSRRPFFTDCHEKGYAILSSGPPLIKFSIWTAFIPISCIAARQAFIAISRSGALKYGSTFFTAL